MSSFVTSDQAVTSYFLASDNKGDGFATSGAGVATGLYVGAVSAADEIYLYGTSDPNVVIGRIGGDTGAVALVIALHGDPANPELGVAVYAPITDPKAGSVDDADSLNLDGLIYLGSNFTTTEEHDFDTFAGVPSGSDQFAMIKPDTVNDLQLLVTGFTGTTEQKITISQDANFGSIGGGGSGQHVASGNSLRIDFVTGAVTNLSSSQLNDFSNLSYTGHEEADKASFTLVQVNPGSTGTTTSLNIFAYDSVGNYQGSAFPTNASSSEGTDVPLSVANVHVLDTLGHVVTSGVTITAATGGGIHITGLQTGYTVVFSTPGTEFDRFTVTNTQPASGAGSNVTFDIGHVHVTTVSYGSGTEFTNIGSHMIFEDGGPSFGTNGTTIPSITVDEDTLGVAGAKTADFSGIFHPSYGPDGKGSLTYALSIGGGDGTNSTLVDTATGHGIFLYMDGNDIVGRVGTDLTHANSSGTIDFRISVDSTGTVTFEQDYAVKHSDPNAADEPAAMTTASLVQLKATATDGDGDSATSAAANIGTAFTILDDEPHSLGTGSNVTVGNNLMVSPPAPELSDTASGSFANPVNAGNDGLASFTIQSYDPGTGTWSGPDSSGDYTWAYGSGGTDHSTIIESYKGSALFTLTLNSSGGVYDGTYTVTMQGTLPYGQVNLDANNIKAGGPTGSIDVGTINDNGEYVQISGLYNTTYNSGTDTLTGTTGSVNASNGNVGVNNGNLDSGEVLGFSLYSSGNTLIPFYGLDMGTKTAQSSSYELYGLLDSDHTSVIDLGPAGPYAKGGTIHYAGNVLLDEIFVKETTGNAVKIGLAGVHLLTPPDDAGFHFAAVLTDKDGDTTFSPFNVYIDGNNDGTVDTAHVLFPA